MQPVAIACFRLLTIQSMNGFLQQLVAIACLRHLNSQSMNGFTVSILECNL